MNPKVSILAPAYNHERYIQRAIEGVLMQRTDFAFEMVIGEDCSTDRTREIALRYQAEHPDKIRVLVRESNMGGRRNWIDIYNNCGGEYVALLDCDDYWTSPEKLQRQVDLLDGNRRLSQCFHPVLVIHEDGSQAEYILRPAEIRETYALEDLGFRNFMMTCSVMFRRGVIPGLPALFPDAPVGDWFIHCTHALRGPIGYIDDPMGVYRVNEGGVFYPLRNDRRLLLRRMIKTAEVILRETGPAYKGAFMPHILDRQYELLGLLLEQGDRAGALECAEYIRRERRFSRIPGVRTGLQAEKLILRTRHPRLEKPIRVAEKLVSRVRRLGRGGAR